MRYLSLEEVIYLYTEVIQRTGGNPGIADERALESVLNKPLVSFEGEDLYPDLFTKVAVFMYALISNRPFIDGNKRTALMCAMFLLRSNGYQVIAPKDQLVDLVKGVENGHNKVDQLVTWIRKNTLPI
jgi:death-on-curing protein